MNQAESEHDKRKSVNVALTKITYNQANVNKKKRIISLISSYGKT